MVTNKSILSRRILYVIAIALYLVISATTKITSLTLDIPAFYVPAIKNILAGYPFSIYAIRVPAYGVSFPNTLTPLTYYLMTPFVWLAQVLKLNDFATSGGLIVILPFLLFDILAGLELRNTIKRLKPGLPESLLFLAFSIFLFSPLLFFSTTGLAHGESILLYFSLLGLRQLENKRHVLAGLAFGIAFLFKSTAILMLVPMLVILLIKGQKVEFLKVAGVSFGITALVLAPFFVRHFADTYYSLILFERVRPIAGVTIWQLATNTSFKALATRIASLPILPMALILSYMLLRKKPIPDLRSPRMYGAVATSVLMIPLFTKWALGPHYAFLAFSFLLIWDFLNLSLNNRIGLFTSIILIAIIYSFSFLPPDVLVKASPAFLVRCVATFLMLSGLIGYVFYRNWSQE